MFPRKVNFAKRSRFIQVLIDLLSVECPERAGGDENSYLWFSATRHGVSQSSRLRSMKDHASVQAREIANKIDENSVKSEIEELSQKLAELHRRFDKFEMSCPFSNPLSIPALPLEAPPLAPKDAHCAPLYCHR